MITAWVRMKNKRNTYLGVCIILIISILISACSGIFKTPEPVTIRFGSYEDFPASYDEHAKEFNAGQTGITVELVPYFFEGDAVSSGNQFDCYSIAGSTLAFLLHEGEIDLPAPPLSLDGFIEGDADFDLQDYFPGPLRQVTSQGSIMALPAAVYPTVMYYNKDLFDQHGLEYPQTGWTWDDFLEAAIAIRDPVEDVWGYISRMGLLEVLIFILQHGGNIVDDLENPNAVTFTDPLTIEALEWYADLIHTYQVSPPSREPGAAGTYFNSDKVIMEGKAGMWSGFFFERLDISAEYLDRGASQGPELPYRVGIAPLPRDAISATYADTQVLVISSETENTDACWQWITYLSDQMIRNDNLVPARRSLTESKEYENRVGREAAQAARAGLENTFVISNELRLFVQDVGESLEDAVIKIEIGEWTPQEAMEWLQEQAEKK